MTRLAVVLAALALAGAFVLAGPPDAPAVPTWLPEKMVNSGVVVVTRSFEARRCVYLYTLWMGPADYERVAICTVPYRADPGIAYWDSGCVPGLPCPNRADPKRMLQTAVPAVECQGKGCEP